MPTRKQSKSRPNILMIMADQLPARCLGADGHPIVRTPHIDALAARGAYFESAYTNSPICAPSRASMCTGRYVSGLGSYDNGTDFPASTPTFMHHLRRCGYEVVLSGKMHFLGPDQLHGFERRLTSEIYPSSFAWTPDWTRGAYHNPGTAVDQLRTAGLCGWSMQLDYDEEVHFRSLEALRDFASRQEEDRPFFLCASYTHPHDPFVIHEPWWNLYHHDDIDLPKAPAVPTEDMHPFNQWLQTHHMVDVFPPAEEHVRNARHAFYGMVSYFDAKVGELVSELERLGLADNTIVVVTSDHGEMLGEHGMWFKRTYFEPSVRVPLIMAGTDRVRSGCRLKDTVSLVDLFPTFLELAGLRDMNEVIKRIDGDSLCGLLQPDGRPWKNWAISEYLSEGVLQPMRMAVSGTLKYVYVHEEEPQLFDLSIDPLEQHNRFHDPAYKDRLERLLGLVHTHWKGGKVRRQVLESQWRRRMINEANANGTPPCWDAQPAFDARQQYVRNRNAQATSEERRFPKVEGPDTAD